MDIKSSSRRKDQSNYRINARLCKSSKIISSRSRYNDSSCPNILDSEIKAVCLDVIKKKVHSNEKIVKEKDNEIEKMMCQNRLLLF